MQNFLFDKRDISNQVVKLVATERGIFLPFNLYEFPFSSIKWYHLCNLNDKKEKQQKKTENKYSGICQHNTGNTLETLWVHFQTTAIKLK